MSRVSTKELFKIWSNVAAHSFGGPAGQIAVIHKLVVEDKKLISEERFLHALNFCMLLAFFAYYSCVLYATLVLCILNRFE